jgi:ribonucleoside-diphosphate reductase alpha chain
MATVLSAQSSNEASSDPALEKVNREHGVEYAKQQFGTKLRSSGQGLKVQATFCPEDGQTPFATSEWDLRSAAIKDESGKALFEQTN